MLRCESGDDAVLADYFEEMVLVMAGRDPYALVEEAVTEAAARSGGARPLRDKRLPPNIDVFGWCAAAGGWAGGGVMSARTCRRRPPPNCRRTAITSYLCQPNPLPPNRCSWDSYYSAVSASGLSDAVQSLSSGGAPPRWVVIDDGWQCTEVRARARQLLCAGLGPACLCIGGPVEQAHAGDAQL